MAFTITNTMAQAAAERFWAKVSTKPGPCWKWTAETYRGYGRLRVHTKTATKWVRAHRLSYVLHCGEIPEGLIVRHTCDNPSCVNPDHLLLGTQADNMTDKVRRGRVPDLKGERNPFRKLNDDDIRHIRHMLDAGHSQQSVGILLGVHQRTIGRIALKQTWAHVT